MICLDMCDGSLYNSKEFRYNQVAHIASLFSVICYFETRQSSVRPHLNAWPEKHLVLLQ